MKLYSFPPSANPYKVRLFLAILGLDYETVQVDLMNGEQKSPEFLKIDSFGQVPVLVDGNVTVSDAQACLAYLARKYGGAQYAHIDA